MSVLVHKRRGIIVAFTKIKYLSKAAHRDLIDNVENNVDKYKAKDFSNFSSTQEWSKELKTAEIDLTMLHKLDANDDLKSVKILNKALINVTPHIANEMGIWARLSHVECIDYCFKRFEKQFNEAEKKGRKATVTHCKSHFCGMNLDNRVRDNPMSRLWYTHYFAKKIVDDNPDYKFNFDEVLKDITPSETRSSILERRGITKFSSLTASIIHTRLTYQKNNKKLVQWQNRDFLTNISSRGAGLLFDLLSKKEIDKFCNDALVDALKP